MVRRTRLISGLILLAYVTTHLLNHALGLVSLQAMEEGRTWFVAIWRSPLGTFFFLTALLVHFGLALWAIYQRQSPKIPLGEAGQLLLGIAIPLLLLEHMIGTRGSHEFAGTHDSYTFVLLVQWKIKPSLPAIQTLGVLAAWLHGCIGAYYWVRLRPVYPRIAPFLLSVAILVPVLSLLGFWVAGREVLRLAENPEWYRQALAAASPPDRAMGATLLLTVFWARIGVVASVVLAIVARLVTSGALMWRGAIRVTYPDGRTVVAAPGPTILDLSRRAGVPHASVCGGRGRCSTCRIRIIDGHDRLSPASPDETRVLQRVGNPINVRLACQARPVGDVSVIPLFPSNATASASFRRNPLRPEQEREIVILFADIRAFTKFAEARLPYDVVFVLNRYFAGMGEAIEQAGGHVDKFIGDGVMALFGTDSDPEDASRRAIVATRTMALKLADLNRTLANELEEPLRIGIGVHIGPAIVGEMGYGEATHLTAIGDAVNTASRLETMTKEYGVQAIISEDVANRARMDLSEFERRQLEVRGKSEKIPILIVPDAMSLPTT